MSWKRVKVGKLATNVTKGTTPTTLGYDYAETGIRFLRAQNILDGQVNFSDEDLFIDTNTNDALKRSQIQPNDVLLSIAGSVGRSAVVPSDAPSLNCNQAVAIVRLNGDVLPVFFRHWLDSEDAQRQMAGASVTMTISNLSLTQIKNLEIPLPELGEQRRIAAVLDKADALRQKRRAALARLDTLLQATFLHMFGDQDVEMVPISEAMAAIIDYRGKTPPKTESGIPLVTAKVVKDGFIEEPNEFIAEDFYDEWMRRGLPKVGDVVFTTEAPLGKVAQLKSSRIALAQRIVLLRGNPDFLDNKYLMHALSTPIVRQQIEQRATGSTVRGIRQKELRKVEVPIPQLEKQKEFNAVASKIEYLQSSHKDALLHLDNLFHALQQRAFSGQL